MTLNANEALKPYATMFKGWQVKLAGEKPTGEMLATAHGLGCRPGKQALAMAMALRAGGVTGTQIIAACGAPQLNKMRDTVHKGLAKWAALPMTEAGHKVYHLELTAKGNSKVAKAEAPKAEAPAKAKRVSKPKAKPAPVSEPQVNAAPVSEAPAVQPQA